MFFVVWCGIVWRAIVCVIVGDKCGVCDCVEKKRHAACAVYMFVCTHMSVHVCVHIQIQTHIQTHVQKHIHKHHYRKLVVLRLSQLLGKLLG